MVSCVSSDDLLETISPERRRGRHEAGRRDRIVRNYAEMA
jgi:hypothetical protein